MSALRKEVEQFNRELFECKDAIGADYNKIKTICEMPSEIAKFISYYQSLLSKIKKWTY